MIGGDGGGREGRPDGAVTTLFAAIAADDRRAGEPVVTGALAIRVGGARCTAALTEMPHHGLALVGLRDVIADGRDPEARLCGSRSRATAHRATRSSGSRRSTARGA